MQQTFGRRSLTGPAVGGLVLIATGAIALVLRATGSSLGDVIGAWGWPFFIIVPGIVLLAMSFVPVPPKGLGLGTAGAIVTTVGTLLLYQSRTGHWESWSYAWALLPLAAGLAVTIHGLLARQRSLVASGLWTAGIASALFIAGAWYFERLFDGSLPGLDPSAWWPVAVIVLGAVLVLRAVLFPAAPPAADDAPDAPGTR